MMGRSVAGIGPPPRSADPSPPFRHGFAVPPPPRRGEVLQRRRLLRLPGKHLAAQSLLPHQVQLVLHVFHRAWENDRLLLRGGQLLRGGHHLVQIAQGALHELISDHSPAGQNADQDPARQIVPEKMQQLIQRVVWVPDYASAYLPGHQKEQQEPGHERSQHNHILQQHLSCDLASPAASPFPRVSYGGRRVRRARCQNRNFRSGRRKSCLKS